MCTSRSPDRSAQSPATLPHTSAPTSHPSSSRQTSKHLGLLFAEATVIRRASGFSNSTAAEPTFTTSGRLASGPTHAPSRFLHRSLTSGERLTRPKHSNLKVNASFTSNSRPHHVPHQPQAWISGSTAGAVGTRFPFPNHNNFHISEADYTHSYPATPTLLSAATSARSRIHTGGNTSSASLLHDGGSQGGSSPAAGFPHPILRRSLAGNVLGPAAAAGPTAASSPDPTEQGMEVSHHGARVQWVGIVRGSSASLASQLDAIQQEKLASPAAPEVPSPSRPSQSMPLPSLPIMSSQPVLRSRGSVEFELGTLIAGERIRDAPLARGIGDLRVVKLESASSEAQSEMSLDGLIIGSHGAGAKHGGAHAVTAVRDGGGSGEGLLWRQQEQLADSVLRLSPGLDSLEGQRR